MTSQRRPLLLGAYASACACVLPAVVGDDGSETGAPANASTLPGDSVGEPQSGSDVDVVESSDSSTDTGADTGAGTTKAASTDDGLLTDGGTTKGPFTSTSDTSGGSSSETGEPIACVVPAEVHCDDADDDLLHALGLGCPGGTEAGGLTVNAVSNSFAVASQYGDIWTPTEGDRMLVITTETLVAGDIPGTVVDPGYPFNDNPDDAPMPAPLSLAHGSNGGLGGTPFVACDGVDDCADAWDPAVVPLELYDLATVTFSVEVPEGVTGLRVDYALISAEYPEWVGSIFGDYFWPWIAGQEFTGFACGHGVGCSLDAIALAMMPAGVGTVGGGSTGWQTLRIPVEANDEIEVTLALADSNDPSFGSAVVLDRVRFECGDCRTDGLGPCGAGPLLPD